MSNEVSPDFYAKNNVVPPDSYNHELPLKELNENESAFFQAIRDGDLNKVKDFVENKGIDPNILDQDFDPALLCSIDLNKSDIAHYLLSQGADPNKRGYRSSHPLKEASFWTKDEKESINLIDDLIKHGADINAKDYFGNTALELASHSNRLDVVKHLLSNGAKMSPDILKYTASLKNMEVTQYLIDHGANLEYRLNNGNTLLMEAVSSGNPDKVSLFLNAKADIDVNTTNAYGMTALMFASAQDKSEKSGEIIEQLLEAGARNGVNIKDAKGKTALSIAIRKGNFSVVPTLIKNGATLDFANSDQIIMDIVKKTSEKYFRNLAEQRSYKKSSLQTVETLIELGANVECKDKLGNTPIMIATREGDYEMWKTLADKGGADLSVKDNNSRNILMKINQKHEWHKFEKNEQALEIIDRLIKEKAVNINDKDNDGKTALHHTIYSNVYVTFDRTIAHKLVQEGIDVTAEDNTGRTASDCLVASTKRDFDQMVNEALNSKNIDKTTKTTKTQVTEILIDRGANSDILKGTVKTEKMPNKLNTEQNKKNAKTTSTNNSMSV